MRGIADLAQQRTSIANGYGKRKRRRRHGHRRCRFTPGLGGIGRTPAGGAGSFLVSRTAQDTFVVLTAICTHEQCEVTGFQNQRYVCPCHGSEYTTSGSVTKGPAPLGLRQFQNRFANNVLTITL